MLKLYIHGSLPEKVSPLNCLGRLDIGYDKLDAHADYKLVMTTAGLGESSPAKLENYPRWSASMWDLVIRGVCLCLNRREAVWPAELPRKRKGAFMDNLSAVVEHWPDGFETRRAVVGRAHIQRRHRNCRYVARFEDDILGARESTAFVHTPEGLSPWDLLSRAYAWTESGSFVLHPRPTLYTPIPVTCGTESYVSLETVSEPARTGIFRWMARRGDKPAVVEGLLGPCVPESHFVTFLRRAV